MRLRFAVTRSRSWKSHYQRGSIFGSLLQSRWPDTVALSFGVLSLAFGREAVLHAFTLRCGSSFSWAIATMGSRFRRERN